MVERYKGDDLGLETDKGGSLKLPKETHFNRRLLLVIIIIQQYVYEKKKHTSVVEDTRGTTWDRKQTREVR